jgi:serine/threonine protein phosphatase PrpC
MLSNQCLDMEDAHTHILALPDDKSCAFLAVYDGHGGAKVAQHSCKHLHTRIANQPDFSSWSCFVLLRFFLVTDQCSMKSVLFFRTREYRSGHT